MVQAVLAEVQAERARQHVKWGEQNHPDGTGGMGTRSEADFRRQVANTAAREGRLTWRHILLEEVAEAMAETDEDLLRGELLQVAAVAVAHIEALDRRRR